MEDLIGVIIKIEVYFYIQIQLHTKLQLLVYRVSLFPILLLKIRLHDFT